MLHLGRNDLKGNYPSSNFAPLSISLILASRPQKSSRRVQPLREEISRRSRAKREAKETERFDAWGRIHHEVCLRCHPERSEGSPKNRIAHASYQRDVCFDCEISAPPSHDPAEDN